MTPEKVKTLDPNVKFGEIGIQSQSLPATEPGEDTRPCVILGSGFSRAISEAMPMMYELGTRVLEELDLEPTVLDEFGGNLEQWMSYLAVDQPWLTPPRNFENRARFGDVSDAVYNCIRRAEVEVLETIALPDWLLRLAWTWCDKQAQVFTFNYDTLLERAVFDLSRLDTFGDLYAMPLVWRLAAGDGSRFGGEGPRGQVLSLYKLHGSVSWMFGGLNSPPNDQVLLRDDFLGWRIPALNDEPVSPRELSKYDDVVPLIIPPTLTKGPYYSNQSLRGQWRRAAEALSSAQSLSIMGYSFPPADIMAQQWVATSFRGQKLQIVDSNPERVAAIRGLLPHAPMGEDATGTTAVQDYVERECGPLVRWSIWDEPEVGTLANLIVNGTDLLADMTSTNARGKITGPLRSGCTRVLPVTILTSSTAQSGQ
jgi:hypothetical protein